MTLLREGQQAYCGIVGCTTNYLAYFLVYSVDFWLLAQFLVKVNNFLMPSLPIWRKGIGFYYIIKLLLLFTSFFWTFSHWICLKWVHVQLWEILGNIMLLPVLGGTHFFLRTDQFQFSQWYIIFLGWREPIRLSNFYFFQTHPVLK